MNIICNLFGHNYSIMSTFGKFVFCYKCGQSLKIDDRTTLKIGERKWSKDGILYEQTSNGLQEIVIEEE